MRNLPVVLTFCLLLADDVVLQSTARLQPVANAQNGALEKNGSVPVITLPPHLRENRFHLVTSGPVKFIPPQSITSIPNIPEVSNEYTEVAETTPATTPSPTTSTTSSTTTTREQLPSSTAEYITTIRQRIELMKQTVNGLSDYTMQNQAALTTTEMPNLVQISTTVPKMAAETSTTVQRQQTTTRRPSSTTPTRDQTTWRQPIAIRSKIPAQKAPNHQNTMKNPPENAPNEHNLEVRSGPEYNKLQRCPRSEDIHPCECVEVATPAQMAGDSRAEYEVETVAFCKNIRNVDVLREALRGMQGHHLTYLVMDSVHLPPFPNDLFKNVGVGWMEVLNSTMQFRQEFFQCYEKGCS